MSTNVSLTPELEGFAQSCVESGRYNNVSEVVRSALRLLEEREQWRSAMLASLEDAEREGERDGFFTFEEVESRVLATIDRVAVGKE